MEKEWRYLIKGGKHEDEFISYESYYQGDGTGDFTKNDVIIHKEEASSKMRFSSFSIFLDPHPFPIGNPMVRCGPFEMWWTSGSSLTHWLNFNFKMLYGKNRSPSETKNDYELAPSKWTDISKVNVFDPRIRWYRPYQVKDDSDITIPIDKLWEENAPKQESKKEGKTAIKSK